MLDESTKPGSFEGVLRVECESSGLRIPGPSLLSQMKQESRSVLAERFRDYLNESPRAYLTRWRRSNAGLKQSFGATDRSGSRL